MSGGTVHHRLRSTALSVACVAVVVLSSGCGSPPHAGAAAASQTVTTPSAALSSASSAAAPASAAGLSPGMTLAPVPTVPPVPAGPGPDDCLNPGAKAAVANGQLVCQYFTSGSLIPAGVPAGEGLSSGDYAIRFSSVGGSPLMTVRVPCASYAVRVSITGQTITPGPGTMESFAGMCEFPWDQEQQRMAQYLQAPLEFVRKDTGIALHNAEWGITLFRTPYEAR